MAVETTRDNVCINQIMAQKNESVVIEGDSIIPDIKPDILNAISTSGTVCIYKKEILDGKVRLDGGIDVYVMYLADDETSSVRSINTTLDFTQMIDLETAKPDMFLDTKVTLRNIECRVINGRKISIKAILDIEIKISANEDVEIINHIEVPDIQMLNKDLCINSLIGSGNTKVYAKDTIMLDNIDNLAEVMKIDMKIVNKDTKISYNKVLAKSDLNVKLLYLTDDNRIQMVESIIPVMGFIDIPDINEDNICELKYELKNIIVKPNSIEEHSVYVEAEIEIYCRVFKNQEVNLIQDLYSPSTNLLFTQRKIKVMQQREITQNTCNIREKQTIPELQGNKIYDVTVEPEITNQTLLNDRILYEGEVTLNYIFGSNNNSGVDTKKIKIPFTFNVDFSGVTQTSQVETSIEIALQDFVISADDTVEVKIDLLFSTELSRNTDINIIDDIKEEENKNVNIYSMVIYFVKPGDSLWKIAKKFGSTMEEIARVNGIEPIQKINVGQQLFIPRYHG